MSTTEWHWPQTMVRVESRWGVSAAPQLGHSWLVAWVLAWDSVLSPCHFRSVNVTGWASETVEKGCLRSSSPWTMLQTRWSADLSSMTRQSEKRGIWGSSPARCPGSR